MNERVSRNDFGVGTQALRLLRDATADICDVTVFGAQDEFRCASTAAPIGAGALLGSHTSALHYHRTPMHIARSGIDHYQVTLCLADVEFSSGRRNISMRSGDVFLVDMAQSNRTTMIGETHSVLSHVLSLLLPRALLAPLLALPDSAGASLLPRDTSQARFLAEQLLALYNRSEQLTPEDGVAAVNTVTGLVADAVGQRSDAEAIVTRAKSQALVASIKHYIDAHLQTEVLTVERLCRRFQLSRATLYRLFETEGGLSRYIQDQKLNLAFKRLISPAFRETRIIDFAADFNFASDTTFVRAFRRQFGLTPGEIRHLASSRAGTAGPDNSAWPLVRLTPN
jgi:AraC-like DNA-binding protein